MSLPKFLKLRKAFNRGCHPELVSGSHRTSGYT